jgi:predicted nucleotide-binding protein
LTPSYPNVTRQFLKSPPKEQAAKSEKTRKQLSKNVFIVHGTDQQPVKELKAILEETGLKPIILHEQPSRSMTIIEKLEKYSDASFAFIILTPDDLGMGKNEVRKLWGSAIDKEDFTLDDYQQWSRTHPTDALTTQNKMLELLKDRARQNVVLEFGYFMGRLSREKICCLYKGDIDLPSDMHGICYVHFNNSVNEIKQTILKELKDAGYVINN